MATLEVESKNKDSNPAIGLTQTTDYINIKDRGKWQNKHQFEVTSSVRKRLDQLVLYRRTSCYWSTPFTGPTLSEQDLIQQNINTQELGTRATGSNWNIHWDLMYKAWIKWKQYIEGMSNLRSPISFANVEAMMAEFQENNYSVFLQPQNDHDKSHVLVYKAYLRYLESKRDFAAAKASSFHTTAITGTGITYNPYIDKRRKVDKLIKGEEAETYIKSMKKKDPEYAAKMLKRLTEDNMPITQEVELIDYNDPAIIPVNIYEFFIDDSARVLQGLNHEAIDCIWRTTPSVEQCLIEFGDMCKDPYVVKENVKKVKPAYQAAAAYGMNQKFFKTPNDLVNNKTKVELVRYYNKVTDKYIVIANDVLIREGPLPYNHKELPFSRHTLVNFEDQFYGIGVPAVLEDIQAADETILNMYIENSKISLNPPVVFNNQIFEDMDSQYQRIEPGQKIEGSGPVTSDNMRWFEGPQMHTQDVLAFRQSLAQDSIKAAGINDLAYANSAPNEAVRNNVMAMESTFKIIKKGIKNWAEGYKESVRQILSHIEQFIPEAFVEEAAENTGDKVEKRYKQIPLDDFTLTTDTQTGELKEEPSLKRTFFEIKPEFLELREHPEIIIDIDTILPISANMEIARSEQALQILIPLITDPEKLANPMAMELIKDFCKTHGFGSNIMDKFQRDEDDLKDIDKSKTQNAEIVQGKSIPGEPGESDAHKLNHAMLVFELKAKIEEVEKTMKVQELQANPQAAQEHDKAINTYNTLIEHLKVDNQSKMSAGKVAEGLQPKVTMAQAQTQSAMQQIQPPVGPSGPQMAPGGQQPAQMNSLPPMGPQGSGGPPMM